MNNMADLFQNLISGMGNSLNVLMVGKIKEYNSGNNTATIESLHTVPKQSIPYAPLINVPVGFFNLGGFSIKVKPKINDVVLVLFADYDIDNLLIDGTKTPNTDRTHALEDAIILPLSINFLNSAFNATEDLTISKDGTSAYVKITSKGELVFNADIIKLGEGASKKVLIEGGEGYTTCNKVYAE